LPVNRPFTTNYHYFSAPGTRIRIVRFKSTRNGGQHMSNTTRQLRAHAKECLQTAIAAKDPAQKAALLLIADAERKLASQSERMAWRADTNNPTNPAPPAD
jgi:hypothetical protein